MLDLDICLRYTRAVDSLQLVYLLNYQAITTI